MKIVKEELQTQLRTDHKLIKFTKKDGTFREMVCTLDSKVLPKQQVVEGEEKEKKKENPNVIAVWDVTSKGWRSIILESILEIVDL